MSVRNPPTPADYLPGARDPNRANLTAMEFYAVEKLLSTSPEFAAFYQHERGRIGRLVEWVLDPTLPPGINAASIHHTDFSTVNLSSLPATDPFLVAHELTHILLYERGFRGLVSRMGDNLGAALTSLFTDPQVNAILARYGFDLAARYEFETGEAQAALLPYGEPSDGLLRLLWAVNFVALVLEHRAAYHTDKPHDFHKWFRKRYPNVAKEADKILSLAQRYRVDTPRGERQALQAIVRHYRLGGRLCFDVKAQPDEAAHYPQAYRMSWQSTTTPNGTTWTETQVTPYYHTGTNNSWRSAVYVSPHVANKALVGAWKSTGTTGATAGIFQTTDAGASWAEISPSANIIIAVPTAITIPFQNAAETVIFYGDHKQVGGVAGSRLYRRKNGTDTNISPQIGSQVFGPSITHFRTVIIPDDDQNTCLLIAHGDTGSGVVGVFLSHNVQAATPIWTTIVTPAAGVDWRRGYALGGGRFILIGNDRTIAVLANDVLDSRAGNIASNSPQIVGICGG